MKLNKVLRNLSVFSMVLAASACAQEDSRMPPDDGSSFAAARLVAPAADEWLTNGGNLYNQRWSGLSQINRDNVANLKGVWRTHLNGSGMETRHSGEAQPLYHDGVLYTSTGDNDVFALSVDTGELLWTYEAQFPEEMGKSVCCGWVSRGVGLGDGKVFVGQLDAKLLALDMDTGEVLWETQGQRWEEGYSITSAPLYYDGMVITGYAGAEYGVRGVVEAFDADTGEKIWSFYTVPGPGEFGHDTWPQDNDVWMFGGATVWQTPAVDPELGMLYFATGNPGPDFNGYVREGDNLFSVSVVAIDVETGEYRWHFQQVRHDLWDYDSPNPVILFDIELKGEARKGIASAGKTGWVYILDRVTGEPLIGMDYREVPQEPLQKTAATQPYPVGESFIPQFLDVAPEGVTLVNQGRIFTPFAPGRPVMVQPGLAGGANWPPSAYDPTRQLMYVCASESAMMLEGGGPDLAIPEERTGDNFTGGGMGSASKPQTGIIAAVDLHTNTLEWQYRWPDTCYSGFMATAGDLLFVGRNDGRLTALDSDTGLQLWEFQTGAGMNAPVTTFEYEGTQYVAAYSAGNLFAGSARGDSIWLFSLDGSLEQTTPGDAALASAQQAAQDTEVVFAEGEADLAAGARLYRQTCLPCHGEDGMGGHGGGIALDGLSSIRDTVILVTRGRNSMPGFSAALTPEQIRDVSTFVHDDLMQQD